MSGSGLSGLRFTSYAPAGFEINNAHNSAPDNGIMVHLWQADAPRRDLPGEVRVLVLRRTVQKLCTSLCPTARKSADLAEKSTFSQPQIRNGHNSVQNKGITSSFGTVKGTAEAYSDMSASELAGLRFTS